MRLHLPHPSKECTKALGKNSIAYRRPVDMDSLLDKIPEEHYEKDRFLPYWAELWPATEALIQYVSQPEFSDSPSVCDLGCGLGVLSIALGLRGAKVFPVDIAHDACVFANHNIAENGLPPRAMCGDWRTPPFSSTFDLVVAADVLYEPRWVKPVIDFLGTTLAPNGRALIADPLRASWGTFKRTLEQRGFVIESSTTIPANEGKTRVEIIEARKTVSRM